MSEDSPRCWPSLRIRLSWSRHEAVEAILVDAGALSVSVVDAGDGRAQAVREWTDLDPGWREVQVEALFDDTGSMELARGALLDAGVDPGAVAVADLTDRDWVRTGHGERRPHRVGRRLWVCPRGRPPPRPDSVTLFIDPGLAFGTGDHATTALCLDRLSRMRLAGARVLDFGCGSGILAVAALRLGAAEAVGVDNDPRALAVSGDNARDNGVAERYRACAPGDPRAEGSFDVVIANILAGTLVQSSDVLTGRVRSGGRILLSGILRQQSAEVQAAYAAAFDLRESVREEWVLLYGRRRRTAC